MQCYDPVENAFVEKMEICWSPFPGSKWSFLPGNFEKLLNDESILFIIIIAVGIHDHRIDLT